MSLAKLQPYALTSWFESGVSHVHEPSQAAGYLERMRRKSSCLEAAVSLSTLESVCRTASHRRK